jgi:hypothetical protein
MFTLHLEAGKVSMIRREIKKGLNRTTGCSWIEVKDKVHVFSSMETVHILRVMKSA